MGDVMRHGDHGPGVTCRPALGYGLCEPLAGPDPDDQEDRRG